MGNEVSYLYEPDGSELHWDGLKAKPKPSAMDASFSGSSNPLARKGLAGTSPTQASLAPRPPPTKEQSPEELMRMAKDMLATDEAKYGHSLQQGSSVSPRTDAGTQVPEWLRREMEKDASGL